jgi:hypothetical protein
LPEDRRTWCEEEHSRHKRWLGVNKNNEALPFWFGSNFRELAKQLGFEGAYNADYRFLSHVAHCSSRGLLLATVGGTIHIQSDRLIRETLVYGTKYALYTAANWNEHFHLIDAARIDELLDNATNFDFKREP